jgi:hypothetical protein
LGCVIAPEAYPFGFVEQPRLANSNDANPGDVILQPGSVTADATGDAFALLEQFCPIEFSGSRDCSVARAVVDVGNALAPGGIAPPGPPEQPQAVNLAAAVAPA